jgi:hypothetical protein
MLKAVETPMAFVINLLRSIGGLHNEFHLGNGILRWAFVSWVSLFGRSYCTRNGRTMVAGRVIMKRSFYILEARSK